MSYPPSMLCGCSLCVQLHEQQSVSVQDTNTSMLDTSSTAYGDPNDLHYDIGKIGWGDINGTDSNGTVTITYRYSNTENTSTGSFNEEQRALTENVLAQYEDAANVRFVEVGENEEANLVFQTEKGDLSYAGRVDGFPSNVHDDATQDHINIYITDSYFNNDSSQYGNPSRTVAHEVGHSLGLSHPAGISGDNPDFNRDGTLMSYNNGNVVGSQNGQPMGPQGLDIKALHNLYGPSLQHKGNNIYEVNGNKAIYTIAEVNGDNNFENYGSGGTDTLYFNTNKDATVDLQEGTRHVSHAGQSYIWVAGDIENAKTLAGNDTVAGNELHNRLMSGEGDDQLLGLGGNDTLDAGGGNDTLLGGEGHDMFSMGDGNDRSTGGNGQDSFYIDNNDTGNKIRGCPR